MSPRRLTRCPTRWGSPLARARALGLALLLAAAATARADIVDAVNALRRDGCAGSAGHLPSLARRTALDSAAHRLATGEEIGAALLGAGYRAEHAFAAHVAGAPTDAALGAVLARDYCTRLLDGRLREAGGLQRGGQAWIVLATPADRPELADPARVARRVLDLVNVARARRRDCGTRAFAAAPPLAWSEVLAAAARRHALDMERHHFFDHTGSDGSDPMLRITRAGYAVRAAGENLAFNQESAAEVVRGWLASPHHCANLMDPRFRELGLAFVVSRDREQSVYWDLTLGARRHL